jgi:hypothetical protein
MTTSITLSRPRSLSVLPHSAGPARAPQQRAWAFERLGAHRDLFDLAPPTPLSTPGIRVP